MLSIWRFEPIKSHLRVCKPLRILEKFKIIPVMDSIITDKNTFNGFPEAGRGIAVNPFPSFRI